MSQIELAVVSPLISCLSLELEDRAGAQKADAGRNALNHSRVRGRVGRRPTPRPPAQTRRAPIAHHHVGPQPGPMPAELAFQAEDAAQHRGHAKPQ